MEADGRCAGKCQANDVAEGCWRCGPAGFGSAITPGNEAGANGLVRVSRHHDSVLDELAVRNSNSLFSIQIYCEYTQWQKREAEES
jgi:hypothetical protein